MKPPNSLTDFETEPDKSIQKYMRVVTKGGFKPTRESAIKAALELAYLY